MNIPLTFLLSYKNLWKNCVERRNSCQQIPEKDQSYVEVGRNNVNYTKKVTLWVRVWSIFCCNVNGEFTFNEQWMKKTSKDSTLDFFWCLSKNFLFQKWVCDQFSRLSIRYIWKQWPPLFSCFLKAILEWFAHCLQLNKCSNLCLIQQH